MLASATEIVVALGIEDRLVGISHECDWPPRVLDRPRLSRPRFDPGQLGSGAIDRAVRQAMKEFGSVYEIDGERLAALQPSLIITQAVCEVCAVPTPGVRQTARDRGLSAEILSLDAHTLEDIMTSIVAVGEAAGVGDRARDLVAGYRDRIERVRRAVEPLPRPRVLAIEWLDPPFVPGHWLPEMIELAGGENLAGTAGQRSQQVAWEALDGLDPDVLIVMPCGYGVDASRDDADRHADRLLSIAPRAIDTGNAWVVDGSAYFNRSGPRTMDGIEILASMLHAEFAEPGGEVAERWNGTRVP